MYKYLSPVDKIFPTVTRLLETIPFDFDSETEIPINFNSTDDAYIIVAELPGVDKNNITLTVDDLVVCIDVEKVDEYDDYMLKECKYGRFARTLKLPPDFDSPRVTATYENGVLTITAAKKAEDQPNVIEIS